MTQIIQIEGELVRVLETTLLREARLEDVLPHIETAKPITAGMLPKSALFIHWDETDPMNRRVQLFCEQSPGVRTSVWNNRRFVLSIPWTYYLFDFFVKGTPNDNTHPWALRDSRVYWAKEPVSGLDSKIYTALVPNCDTQGGICWGSTGVQGNLPLGVRVDRTISEFYQSVFTHSNGAGSPWQSVTGKDNWAMWDKESKKDPAAWMKFPEWEDRKSGIMREMTVKDVLGSYHDRTKPIEVESAIPEMVTPMTFGRSEEWLKGITAVDRHRLFVALTNMQADEPATMEPPPAAETFDENDLGGELINP